MQPDQLDVSVIVRTCGRKPQFLRRALNSIAAQTRLPALIIVVNDEPEASGVEAELGRMDLRGVALRYLPRDLRIQAQSNPSAALNRGIAAISSRWVAFLDDDDTWMPTFLEKVAPLLKAGEEKIAFGGVVTQTIAVYERLKTEDIVETHRKPFNPGLQVVDLAALVTGNQFTNNSLVVRHDAFAAVGPFREDLMVLYDWEFNVRAAAHFHFEVMPEPLACYHLRPATDASPNTSVAEHLRARIRIRNEWLRADLAAGRLGLGQLALAGEIRGLGAVLAVGRRWRDRISGWLGRTSR
jgi:glycosyltransferase involved in cell wall biosynthesis